MKDATCPYCGAAVKIDHDDGYGYEEGTMHQQECVCGKTFTYCTAIHFTYTTHQAECLNDGEHDYKKTATYPPEFARMRCRTCGDEKAIFQEPVPPEGKPLVSETNDKETM